MKNFVILSGLLAVLVALVFVRCSSNNNNFGGGFAGSGVAGILYDENGDPVSGATIYVPASSTLGLSGATGLSFTDDFGTCDEPISAEAEDGDGNLVRSCTGANGEFGMNCPVDADGNPVTTVDINVEYNGQPVNTTFTTLNCGSFGTGAAEEPLPNPSPSATP